MTRSSSTTMLSPWFGPPERIQLVQAAGCVGPPGVAGQGPSVAPLYFFFQPCFFTWRDLSWKQMVTFLPFFPSALACPCAWFRPRESFLFLPLPLARFSPPAPRTSPALRAAPPRSRKTLRRVATSPNSRVIPSNAVPCIVCSFRFLVLTACRQDRSHCLPPSWEAAVPRAVRTSTGAMCARTQAGGVEWRVGSQ